MTRAIAVVAVVLVAAACGGGGATEAEAHTGGILLNVDGGGYGEIWIVDENGNGLRRLEGRAPESLGLADPEWSPDRTQIAYVGSEHGEREFELYLMDGSGSGPRRVTHNEVPEWALAWRPDGGAIAVARELGWNSDEARAAIVLVDLDGGERQLFEGGTGARFTFVSDLAWSPDGSRIAFSLMAGREGSSISVIDVTSGRVATLLDRAWQPAWSPDGTRLAYADAIGIAVAAPDGTGARRLVASRPGDGWPAWSPDGARIAFASARGGASEYRYNLYVAAIDGGRARRLTNDPRGAMDPDWR
jgi:TolB protein